MEVEFEVGSQQRYHICTRINRVESSATRTNTIEVSQKKAINKLWKSGASSKINVFGWESLSKIDVFGWESLFMKTLME